MFTPLLALVDELELPLPLELLLLLLFGAEEFEGLLADAVDDDDVDGIDGMPTGIPIVGCVDGVVVVAGVAAVAVGAVVAVDAELEADAALLGAELVAPEAEGDGAVLTI